MRELEKIKNARTVLRKSRLRNDVPIIAVVGYTNAGKKNIHTFPMCTAACDVSKAARDVIHSVVCVSTGKTSLIKALTADKRLQPEDKLFATLDVTNHGGT